MKPSFDLVYGNHRKIIDHDKAIDGLRGHIEAKTASNNFRKLAVMVLR